jgi:hypothetical protein
VAKTIQYVVVVHGMGEARQNETILAVASRFAEARSGQVPWPPPSIVVPLGSAMGQTGIARASNPVTGLPWVEFDGIPCAKPGRPLRRPFYGGPSTTGDNIRFVDIHWNDLLVADWPDVGQKPNVWIDGLLGRLIRKNRENGPSAGVPNWVLETLRSLGETVSIVHTIAALRAKELDDLIFNKYLGDVQLYGESPITRGLAIRRFHDRMTEVLREHERTCFEGELAEFTIIAHSLGTIMSADALLTARTGFFSQRTATTYAINDDLNGVYAGYFSDDEEGRFTAIRDAAKLHQEVTKEQREWEEREMAFLRHEWLDHVKAFVTLGSPIDKFLVIWWLNYRYLLDSSTAPPGKEQIPHYNYCEEQDPVGHHLDVAYSSPVFKATFEEKEDRVYTRYAIPGLAHTHYWDDLPLFKWILHKTVDNGGATPGAGGAPPPEPVWFSSGIYWWIVFINYVLVPGAIAAAHVIALNWAWTAEGFNGVALGALMFVIVWLLGRHIIDLFVWWRQILKSKAKFAEGPPLSAAARSSQDPLGGLEAGGADTTGNSTLVDVGAAAAAALGLRPVRWLVAWCSPKGPVDDAPKPNNPPNERERWILEREQRKTVERRFRGMLACLHWTALLLVGASIAWYVWGFATWKDVARLGVLVALIGLLIVGWLIAVHGEVAAWRIGRKDNKFRTICARRIGSRAKKDQKLMDRLPTEGYFDADLPGALLVGAAALAAVAAYAVFLRDRAMPAWLNHKAVSTTLVWVAVGCAGALGYTRTRLKWVKELLKGDDKPLNFGNYSKPTGGAEPESPRPREPRPSPVAPTSTPQEPGSELAPA